MLVGAQNRLNSLFRSAVNFSMQHPYIAIGLVAGTTYLLSSYFSAGNADICNGIEVSSDGRYLNPPDEVCSRLMDKVGFFTPSIKVGIYDRLAYQVATHGENLQKMEQQYDMGAFVSKVFCDIPKAVLSVCRPR